MDKEPFLAGGWLAGPTICGALTHFIAEAPSEKFQPMPPNFDRLPERHERIRDKRRRYGAYCDRGFADLELFCAELAAAA